MSGVLVTGIAGGLAHRVANLLTAAGRDVVGADYRLADPPANVPVYRVSYHKTAFEDVFRRHSFDTVLHLGRVGNLAEDAEMRFDLNVVGTQKLMKLCLDHGVRTLVILSTFHIYGAHPKNHIPISEEDPLRSGHEFPEIADAIQLDSMASTWVHQHPGVRVVVLRPTNVVGPNINNTMSRFLRRQRVPYVAGFNPMSQFLHEDDLASAIVHTLGGDARGVFNLIGGAALPWRTALDIARATTFPLPTTLAKAAARIAGIPAYLVNFYKFPCIITDKLFRETFQWQHRIDVRDTLWTTVAEARERRSRA